MTNEQNTNKFDVFEPKSGHKERFIAKMNQKQTKNRFTISRKWMVAASFLLLFGLSFSLLFKLDAKNKIAPEIEQNQIYFSAVIKQEIKEIEKIKTKETEKVFADALNQMKILEKSYQKLVKDFQKNNDKYILNAMINNFNQRIEILQFVKKQIEDIKQTKNQQNESYTL